MAEINLKQIITEFPDCVTNGARLKAILLDLYPGVARGQINALCTIRKSGIVKEIKKHKNIGIFEKKRWLQILENDYCMAGKVVETSLDMWVEAIQWFDSLADSKFTQAEVNNCFFTAQSQDRNQHSNTNSQIVFQKASDYIFHNQLGYGKIESSDSGWMTVRFDNYSYKTERYSKKDLGKYLRLVSTEEYERFIQTLQNQKSRIKTFDDTTNLSSNNLDTVFYDLRLPPNTDLKFMRFNSGINIDESEWERKYEIDEKLDYGYRDDDDYDE